MLMMSCFQNVESFIMSVLFQTKMVKKMRNNDELISAFERSFKMI